MRWLGREDSNLRMAESKSAALPLGYAPMRPKARTTLAESGRTIVPGVPRRNGRAGRNLLRLDTARGPTIRNRHSCLIVASFASLLPLRSLQRGHCWRTIAMCRTGPGAELEEYASRRSHLAG